MARTLETVIENARNGIVPSKYGSKSVIRKKELSKRHKAERQNKKLARSRSK